VKNFEETIKTIIRKEVGYHRPVLTLDKLKEDLDLDSLDRAELCMMLEEEFEAPIKDEEADSWDTVQDVINHVREIIPGVPQ
jgi:acyl carrier protein